MIVKIVALLVFSFGCASADVDTEVIDAVPPEVNTESAVAFDKDRAGNDPVKYDGAQLWRITYTDQDYKNAVSELQKQFQVSMWNLQMTNANQSYVDMFVKQSVVKDAKCFLESERVPFEVVINDVQEAINNENPSLEDIDLWQNRNGECTPALATRY